MPRPLSLSQYAFFLGDFYCHVLYSPAIISDTDKQGVMSDKEGRIYSTKESDVAKGRESLKKMVGKTRTISVPVIEVDEEIRALIVGVSKHFKKGGN